MLNLGTLVVTALLAWQDADLHHLPLGAPPARFDGNALATRYQDQAARLLGRALISHQGFETLQILCDEIGPRLSGSDNAERAVEWALQRLREQGFENVHKEDVLVPHWVRGHFRVSLEAPVGEPLVGCALGGSIGTPDGALEGPVVAVRDFQELRELPPEKVEGAIVLYTKKMERAAHGGMSGYGQVVSIRSRGAVEAARLGAAASVTRSVGTDRARLPHTGAMNYEEGTPRIPAIALAQEDADRIVRLLERGQEVIMSIDLGCEYLPDRMSANVVAEVVGREKPEEIVLLGGHLDSWDLGTGALDDGAGCAITWEAARLLIELELRPRRTVRLVLFMNEENGLRGGRGYAERHKDELSQHVAALEADRGAGRPLGFDGGVNDEIVDTVRQVAALLTGIGADQVKPGGAGGADISPLFRLGVPCFGLAQDATYYFDFHHTPADTLDKVGPFELALNIGAVSVMTYVLAEMEVPLTSIGR